MTALPDLYQKKLDIIFIIIADKLNCGFTTKVTRTFQSSTLNKESEIISHIIA